MFTMVHSPSRTFVRSAPRPPEPDAGSQPPGAASSMRVFVLCMLLSVATGMQRVLVTGGNQGIGFAVCEKILRERPDCEVVLCARSQEKGEAALERLEAADASFRQRVSMLVMDVADDASVQRAREEVLGRFGNEPKPLSHVLNNAGIGFGRSFEDTLNTNFFGPKRVTAAFLDLVQRPGGRIVNIASASGPMFVAGLNDPAQVQILAKPLNSSPQEIEDLANGYLGMTDYENVAYGLSKACLNAYTAQLSAEHEDLTICSVTPGFIKTQITAGMGASKSPAEGANPVCTCLFGDVGSGFYYGSDSVRSPLDRYRDPGSAAHEGGDGEP